MKQERVRGSGMRQERVRGSGRDEIMMMRQRELGAEQRLQDLELEPIHRGDSHEPIHRRAQQAFHSLRIPS